MQCSDCENVVFLCVFLIMFFYEIKKADQMAGF